MKTRPKISTNIVLINLAIFLIIIGAMALDPVLSLFFFVVSCIISIGAVIKSKGWVKLVALVILTLSLILSISVFTKAKDHMNMYRKSIEGYK